VGEVGGGWCAEWNVECVFVLCAVWCVLRLPAHRSPVVEGCKLLLHLGALKQLRGGGGRVLNNDKAAFASAAQHSTAQHRTAQRSSPHHSAVQHSHCIGVAHSRVQSDPTDQRHPMPLHDRGAGCGMRGEHGLMGALSGLHPSTRPPFNSAHLLDLLSAPLRGPPVESPPL